MWDAVAAEVVVAEEVVVAGMVVAGMAVAGVTTAAAGVTMAVAGVTTAAAGVTMAAAGVTMAAAGVTMAAAGGVTMATAVASVTTAIAIMAIAVIEAVAGMADAGGAMAWEAAGDGHPVAMFGFAATKINALVLVRHIEANPFLDNEGFERALEQLHVRAFPNAATRPPRLHYPGSSRASLRTQTPTRQGLFTLAGHGPYGRLRRRLA